MYINIKWMNFSKSLTTLFLALSLIITSIHSVSCNDINVLPADREIDKLLEMIQQVNESTLKYHVQTIQDFGPHPTGSSELEKLKNHLFQQFTEYGLTVVLKPWKHKFKSGDNIEATLPGIGLNDEIIIICAHYDSISVSPGADDDGSGVACLLTIAEIFSETAFNATIKFVLFSGEEQGLYGSYEYAQDAYNNQENIIGVLCLDGIGYADDYHSGHIIKNYADESSDWIVDISQSVITDYKDIIDLQIERFPNERISDHQSFYDMGYQTSYFLEYTINPYYHTSEDTADKMNFTYLTKVCQLALGTTARMGKVNRSLRNENITINLRGSLVSYPTQLIVRVINNNYQEDTAIVCIHVEMKDYYTGITVEGPFNSPSNWTFYTQITDQWEFQVSNHVYEKNERITLEVTIQGFDDDLGLYQKKSTMGIIFQSLIFIIPT